MKDLRPFLSPSCAHPDRNLLDSIPEVDRAGLLPIIKMAFPFLKGNMLQPFLPKEADFSMQRQHSIMHTEETIMRMNKRNSSPSGKDVHLHDCGSENRRHSFIHNVNDNMRVDESSSSPSISVDGFKGGPHHEMDVLPYNFSLPRTAELEKSCIMTNEKLSLSLGSTPSEKDIHMDATSDGTNLLAYASPESSWLQQQDTSDGAVFPCGDFKRKRVSSLDLNSCTSHKSCEKSMHEEGVSEAVQMHRDPGANFSLVTNTRTCAPSCSGEHKQGSKRVQILSYAEVEDANAQENMAMVVQMGCTHALNGSIHQTCGITTSFSNKSPCASMLAPKGGSDEPILAHVAGSTNIDSTVEEHKLERCHRSNGKQWRCSKNATPGTLYCELHQAYRSKCKSRTSVSPASTSWPCIQREISQTPIEQQITADGCSEQSNKAFVKQNQLDAARCRRTDGKLWQCSQQAIQGSTYCENHHNRRMKSKKKRKADSLVAGKTKADVGEPQSRAVQSTADTSSGDGSCRHGHVIGSKNGLDQSLVCTSESMNVLDVCGASIYTREQSHEDKFGKNIMQLLRMGDVEGVVMSVMAGWKLDTLEASRGASSSDPWNAGCSVVTKADHHGSENGYVVRCHKNDGKQWRCSQLCKPGFVYCEYHQGGQQKVSAGVHGQAMVERPEKLCNEGTGVQAFARNSEGTGCSADIACHKEQVNKETEQLNDDNASQVVLTLKQCQRKDGKGWQCSQRATHGHNYCEHHLVYMSKRNVSKLRRKENRLVAIEKRTEISPAIEVSVCSPSASPSIPTRAVSAVRGKPHLSSASQRQAMRAIIDPLHDSMANPPADAFSRQYIENATSQDQCHSSEKQGTLTADAATTPQESSSSSSIVCKSIPTQEVCAALDIIDPHDIQKQEGDSVDSASNIQKQEHFTSNTSLTAVQGSKRGGLAMTHLSNSTYNEGVYESDPGDIATCNAA